MEAIILILIGAAIFSQSWYILGMYTEGRTMGVVMGALGVVTLATVAFDGASFAPMLLTSDGTKSTIVDALEVVASNNVMKTIIVVWGVYAIGVAAHSIWDLEERAVGFYAAIVAGISLVATLYFFIELEDRYGDGVWLSLSFASLILTMLSGLMFFYLAVPFQILRLLAGWAMMIGGGGVALIGALIASEVIKVTT